MAVDINTTLENIKTAQDTLSTEIADLALSVGQLSQALNDTIEACCKAQRETGTSDTDSPPSDGSVSIGGPGDQFGSQQEYLDAKCLAANAIFDTYRAIADKLHTEDVQGIMGLGAGATGALFALIMLAGPVSWAIVSVAGALLSLAISLVAVALDFENIRDALDNKKTLLINGLYQASNTASAKTGFMATLATATPTLTAPELTFTGYLLTHKSLNQLFGPNEDVLSYVPPSPTVCTGALWTVPHGNPTTPLDQTSITVNSVWVPASTWVPAHHGIRVHIPSSIGDRTVDITSLSGWSANPYGEPTLSDSGYINESGTWTHSDGNPLAFIDDVCVQSGQFVHVASGSPFTMTIEYKTACP